MKKILMLIVLFSFNSIAFSAEDGTGQGKSVSSELFAYCNDVIRAEDGTGQDEAEDGTGQDDAEDGTGQGDAEDGTGQGAYMSSIVSFCNQLGK